MNIISYNYMNLYELKKDIFIYDTPIGYGSFSILYKGFNYKLLKYIAVKQINKIPDKKYLENEVNLMKELNHQNVLRLYDVYTEKNQVYLVIDYCCSDLKKYILTKENKYDRKYFIEILDGMSYINKKNIIHRDIKPQNILIKNNTIKICDFGMSKTYHKYELLSTFCGSPLYMAPEIIKNRKYNNLSDIWSLGVVLYELINKNHPYLCQDKDILWDLIKNDLLDINFNNIDNEIYRSIISNMLSINVDKRMTWEDIYDMEINYEDIDDEIFQIDSDIINNTDQEINVIDNLGLDDLDNDLLVPVPSRFNNKSSQSVLINNKSSINTPISSNSYPVMKGKYFEKYLDNYQPDVSERDDNSIPIYGSSPTQKLGLNNILDKSFGKIKKILNK